PLHHTKRAFFDQVPGKASNGNAPFADYIDATKKFNISLTEKWFAHFRLSKASVWLASVTP
ncbi:hypothetical protein P4526_14680, partial [Geobacillus stearothermophilus]|nr:hypothetical protein [Geobacillus stearothermophilus]